MLYSKKKLGFTLVEMAVVLTVISFIVLGIFVAKDLIRQSQLHSMVEQMKRYDVAINAFIQKYDQYPGDFDKAERYWPGRAVNGNGDGTIGEAGWTVQQELEGIQFWRHLGLAGFIEGNYTGTGQQQQGINIPVSRLQGGAIYVRNRPLDNLHHGRNFPFLEWGKCTGSQEECHNAIVAPKEAYMIDTKMDDGKALNGVVTTLNACTGPTTCLSNGLNCSADHDAPLGSADYNLASDDISCRMNFWLQE